MIKVHISRSTRMPFTDAYIRLVVIATSRFEKKVKGSVDITLVSEARMRQLNNAHRGVDAPTDVLSFPWLEVGEKREPGFANDFIGDVFLSYTYIARQAKRFHVSAKEEFTRMLAHGLLHVVGHDHVKAQEAKRMFDVQEKIVAACMKHSV